MAVRKRTKRLIYSWSPLRYTELGERTAGELQQGFDDLLQPYVRQNYPHESLVLIMKEIVREFEGKGGKK